MPRSWPLVLQSKESIADKIHTKCQEVDITVDDIRPLINAQPDAIQLRGPDGWLALHRICRRQPQLKLLKCLVDAWPESILHWTGDGIVDIGARLPIHLLCYHGGSLSCIQYLARCEPSLLDAQCLHYQMTPLDYCYQSFLDHYHRSHSFPETIKVMEWLEKRIPPHLRKQRPFQEKVELLESKTASIPSLPRGVQCPQEPCLMNEKEENEAESNASTSPSQNDEEHYLQQQEQGHITRTTTTMPTSVGFTLLNSTRQFGSQQEATNDTKETNPAEEENHSAATVPDPFVATTNMVIIRNNTIPHLSTTTSSVDIVEEKEEEKVIDDMKEMKEEEEQQDGIVVEDAATQDDNIVEPVNEEDNDTESLFVPEQEIVASALSPTTTRSNTTHYQDVPYKGVDDNRRPSTTSTERTTSSSSTMTIIHKAVGRSNQGNGTNGRCTNPYNGNTNRSLFLGRQQHPCQRRTEPSRFLRKVFRPRSEQSSESQQQQQQEQQESNMDPTTVLQQYALRLHNVCAQERPLLNEIQMILNNCPNAVSMGSNYMNYLPLHHACLSGASLEVIDCLVQAWPYSVKIRTEEGFLPLHMHCCCCCWQTTRTTQNTTTTTITAATTTTTTNPTGGFNHQEWLAVLKYLVQQYPRSVLKKTKSGETPLCIVRRQHTSQQVNHCEAIAILEQAVTTVTTAVSET